MERDKKTNSDRIQIQQKYIKVEQNVICRQLQRKKERKDSQRQKEKDKRRGDLCERERLSCILRMVFNMATVSPLCIFICLFKSHKRHTSSVV